MTAILTIIHVVVCVFLIAIVLLQHGKGADIGATFGGSSQTVFGTEGPTSLLNRITTISAIVFMCTSVALAYLAGRPTGGSVMEGLSLPAKPAVEQAVPVETSPPAAVPTPIPLGRSSQEATPAPVVPEPAASAPAATEPPPAAPAAGEAPKGQ
ncbi:MAG: preprotein translocase subunit SecG [Thermodesulfobacteriota bacterium]